MVADLFSVHDFMYGSSWFVLSMFLWLSSICVPSYVCFLGAFWVYSSWYESLLCSFCTGFIGFLSDRKLKVYGGAPHMMLSLVVVLLLFNLAGVLPFTYSLTSHFLVTISFSVPFWLVSILLHGNVNWRLFMVVHIYEGVPFVALAMVVLAEWISILIRPITLAVRMSMNVFIGQVIMNMVSAMGAGILYPTLTYKSAISSVLWSLVSMFLLLVEMAIGVLQVFIFVGLLVFYLEEVFVEL